VRFDLPAAGHWLHADTRPGRHPRGAPIVLLPGMLDDRHAWDAVRDHLGTDRTSIVIEATGHGDASPWQAGHDWDATHEADRHAAWLRSVCPQGAHLVGASRGATLAGWLAIMAPELVHTVSFIASPPQASEAFRLHWADILARAGDSLSPRRRDALAYLAAIPEDDFPAYGLRALSMPILVVEAGADPLYSPTHTLFWRAFTPYAEFERRDEADHDFYQHDDGARWLADRLARFVAEHD